MEELIYNKILIIKGILAEKCGLNPELYDELSELLDDIKILSDAKGSALENAYTELRQLTLPVVSKSCDKCKFVNECRYKPDDISNVCKIYIEHVC
jgi:hypothetical protein